MTRLSHPIAPPDGAYLVPMPRVTDAIGRSLRGVFAEAPRLPAEMVAMLSALDRIGHA